MKCWKLKGLWGLCSAHKTGVTNKLFIFLQTTLKLPISYVSQQHFYNTYITFRLHVWVDFFIRRNRRGWWWHYASAARQESTVWEQNQVISVTNIFSTDFGTFSSSACSYKTRYLSHKTSFSWPWSSDIVPKHNHILSIRYIKLNI